MESISLQTRSDGCTNTILTLPHSPTNLIFCLLLASHHYMELLDTIMQVEYIKDTFSEDAVEAITLIVLMLWAPPTNLQVLTYTSLKQALDKIHFHADTGFTFAQFDAIHYALKIPNPVQTCAQDCVDSKTVFFLLCAWLRNQSLWPLKGQYGHSFGAISRLICHLSSWIHQQWGHLVDIKSDKHRLVSPCQC